jgi:hypothetical protein
MIETYIDNGYTFQCVFAEAKLAKCKYMCSCRLTSLMRAIGGLSYISSKHPKMLGNIYKLDKISFLCLYVHLLRSTEEMLYFQWTYFRFKINLRPHDTSN